MKRELKILLTAIMFYTRIPVPKWTGFSAEALNNATRYLPLIGIFVGGFGGLVFWSSSQLFGVYISILISLIFMVLLTGAFHEDGLADFCDGFGGGLAKEQVLSIMKDSRIGTYGTIALVMLFLAKIFLVSEIRPVEIPLAIMVANAWSRLNPVLLIYTSEYVSDEEHSKSKPIGTKGSLATLLIALLLGLSPLFLLAWEMVPFLICIQLFILFFFRMYLHRKIGGYTGDTLGALQQLSEIGFYITYLILSDLV